MLRRLIPTDILFQKTPLIPEVCAVLDIKTFLLIYLSKARFWLMDNSNLRAFCEDI